MPAELSIDVSTLYSFLLVLARIAGVTIFLPLPGLRSGPEPARILLALSMTIALLPVWPAMGATEPTMSLLFGWIVAEAALGIAVGLLVSCLIEAFLMAGQVLSLQAGFSYASMIDPFSQADSSTVVMISQLTAGLLFFATGLHQRVLYAFARSLVTLPPGSFVVTRGVVDQVTELAGGIFTTGLRLALPAVALLMLVDVALGLVGRLNAHLQLITLALPAKIIASLAVLAWTLSLYPIVFQQSAGQMIGSINKLVIP